MNDMNPNTQPPNGSQPNGMPPQVPQPNMPQGPQPDYELESARRLARTAQILALISLIIGGVILAMVALVIAIVSYRKISERLVVYMGTMHPQVAQILKRTATIAVAVSVLALVLNAISLYIMWPVIMEFMQTGDYASLFGSAPSTGGGSSGSGGSFWG